MVLEGTWNVICCNPTLILDSSSIMSGNIPLCCVNSHAHWQTGDYLPWKSRVYSLQFSSVQSCLTLCNPMNRSTPASLSITNSWSSLRLRQVLSEKPMFGLNPLSMGMDNKDLEKARTLITWEPLPSQTIPLVLLLTLWVSAWLSLISKAPSVFSYYLPVLLLPILT